METVEQMFVDTNILIYSTNALSPWHEPALASLQTARQLGTDMVVSTQVLREYLAAATRPSPAGTTLPLDGVLLNLQVFLGAFRVVEDNRLVLDTLVALLKGIPVAGKRIHDANVVATMQVYGIQHLLTHNTSDFDRFSHLITLIPLGANP